MQSFLRSLTNDRHSWQASPFIAGVAVAAVALAGRYGIESWQAWKARPVVPRVRRFYEGGFHPTMTRREAAMILGIRLAVILVNSRFLGFRCHSTSCQFSHA